MGRIKVIVSGAAGKMGREVVKAVVNEPGLELVGACDVKSTGTDAGIIAGISEVGVKITSLTECIATSGAQVMVDFTAPQSVMNNARLALENGVRPVIGTTGIGEEDLTELSNLCKKKGLGAFVAPNFSIGAVLMMKFAHEAARYFPNVEIIELHHDQKLDAPSGTALQTAKMISTVRPPIVQGNRSEVEKLKGARGGDYQGLKIHSVRLPGLVAHQEVIFGGSGQSLTIRHDAYTRETYMPGVIMAIKTVIHLRSLVVGLENLLDMAEAEAAYASTSKG